MTRNEVKNALQKARAEFRYRKDEGDDWKITNIGDCEDFSFFVLYLACRSSKSRMYREILLGKFHFWYVEVGPKKDGHFVTEFDEEYYDNNFGLLKTKVEMELAGKYRFKKKYSKLYVIYKLWRGK